MEEVMINKYIGNKVREYRKKSGMNQRDLAEKMGITHSMVSVYELGKSNFSLTTLFLLSDIFDVPVDNLFPERKKKEAGEANELSFVMEEAETMNDEEKEKYIKNLKLATEYHKSMKS